MKLLNSDKVIVLPETHSLEQLSHVMKITGLAFSDLIESRLVGGRIYIGYK